MEQQRGDSEKNTIFISSLNAVIDDLTKVLKQYKDAQLAFASDIYTSGNGEVFEQEGRMAGYQDELREVIAMFEKQIETLKAVRRELRSENGRS